MAFEIEQNAIQSMWIVRQSYETYIGSGMRFSSWNDPATQTEETFNTFMTIAYVFFVHAENSGLGYEIPLKRMMRLLQTFGDSDRERYSQFSNTPAAETFRSTLFVAALSCAFGEDLRAEFRNLNFPVNDEIYDELLNRVTGHIVVLANLEFDLYAHVLNLGWKGDWVSGCIWFPGGHNVSDIDLQSVKLNDTISVGEESYPPVIGDFNDELRT